MIKYYSWLVCDLYKWRFGVGYYTVSCSARCFPCVVCPPSCIIPPPPTCGSKPKTLYSKPVLNRICGPKRDYQDRAINLNGDVDQISSANLRAISWRTSWTQLFSSCDSQGDLFDPYHQHSSNPYSPLHLVIL